MLHIPIYFSNVWMFYWKTRGIATMQNSLSKNRVSTPLIGTQKKRTKKIDGQNIQIEWDLLTNNEGREVYFPSSRRLQLPRWSSRHSIWISLDWLIFSCSLLSLITLHTTIHMQQTMNNRRCSRVPASWVFVEQPNIITFQDLHDNTLEISNITQLISVICFF